MAASDCRKLQTFGKGLGWRVQTPRHRDEGYESCGWDGGFGEATLSPWEGLLLRL